MATAWGAARGQKLGQPQAHIPSRELEVWLAVPCPLGWGGGQFLLTCVTCACPQWAASISCPLLGLHITLLPLFQFTSHTAQPTPPPLPSFPSRAVQSNIHLLDFLQTSRFVLSVLGLLCSGSLLSEIASWTHGLPEKQSKNNH